MIESRQIISSLPTRIGFGGSYGINYYQDGSLPFPLSELCQQFKTGRGHGLNFLARLDLPLGVKEVGLYFSSMVSYQDLGADHTWAQFEPAGDSSGVLRRIEYDHIITNYSKSIGIGSSVVWRFLHPFFVEAGLTASLLFDQRYSKKVVAINPGDLIKTPSGFVREKQESSGKLPNANSLLLGFSFSFGAEFPLSKTLLASPNIEFSLPITRITNYWTHTSLRGGLTLKYDLDSRHDTISTYKKEQIPIHITVPDEEKKPLLSASIDAVAINRDGKEEHVVRMEVEEVKVHYAFPLLNYIFFDEGSTVIAKRYVTYSSIVEGQRDFKGSSDRNNQGLLELYKETLNILGDRMQRTPKARIVLTGCSSNTGREEGRIDIAKSRAETVKNYLVRVWQIDSKRIRTEARLLPEKPSPSNISQGQEENRRVEIVSSEDGLTDPITVTRTEHVANPPKIFLKPHIFAGWKSFREGFSIGGKELQSFTEQDLLKVPEKTWSPPEDALTGAIDSLHLFLEATDSIGNTIIVHNAIKLEQKRIDRDKQQEWEKFSLILFGFDESTLGSKNERTLSLVAESFKRLKPRKISIVGYTDELGDINHNDELSRRRAIEASQHLERSLRGFGLELPGNIMIDGKGSREELYDNTLPEGRFFSRTVNITVEHGK